MFRLSEKGAGIRDMFDAIAPQYDFLNRLLSFGIDQRWRRFAVMQLMVPPQGQVLDIATGTGDVALEIARQTEPGVRIVGVDFTQGMLVKGLQKISTPALKGRIKLVHAPCEALPHGDESFDGVSIAFGIRNVVDRELGLREMFRVLKPGRRVAILEFSQPRSEAFKAIYMFYFTKLLPAIGGLFSRRSAYQYLPDSVMEFPQTSEFLHMMSEAGFEQLRHFPMTGGIATVYVGSRPL